MVFYKYVLKYFSKRHCISGVFLVSFYITPLNNCFWVFFNELSYKEAAASSTNFWKTAPRFFAGELTETRFFLLRVFLSDENHKFDSFKLKLKCQIHKNLFFNEVAC